MNSNVWRRSATALAAAVPALMTTSACTRIAGDDEFRITKVEFDNASTITLTFSQPVADLGSVDPNNFRLSIGQTRAYSYTYDGMTVVYEFTGYADLSYIIGDYDYYNGYERFSFMNVTAGAAANQIVLQTTDPLGPDACDWLDYIRGYLEMYASYYGPDARFDLAIFLHYAAGDVPIESERGSALGDIGADWVLSNEMSTYRESYGFTMSPQIRIPCP